MAEIVSYIGKNLPKRLQPQFKDFKDWYDHIQRLEELSSKDETDSFHKREGRGEVRDG